MSRNLTRAEALRRPQRRALLARLATELDQDARGASEAPRVRALAAVVRDLADGER